jgi:cell division protein FtsI/penicillin-binding protein 2
MRWSSRTRALIGSIVLTLAFTVFSYRLIQLQVGRHDEYAQLAARKHVDRVTIHGRRGIIEDVRGEILAGNEPVKTVIADGALIKNPVEVASILARHLGGSEEAIREKIATNRRYIVLERRVQEQVADALWRELREKSIRGIDFEQDAIRTYPNGSMLCHVLGFMNHEYEGVQGIELKMNDELRGQDGFRFIERDRTGRELVPYRGQERAPRDGARVRLTIDMGLQHIVEEALDEACAKWKPKGAVAIMMRPSTGEILAMANRPNFDPAQPGKEEPAAMKNAAVINIIEPGSTFKIVTAAAALNEKVVSRDTVIFCENGAFVYGGRTLHDHHGYGDITVEEILMKSSNIGAAKLAMLLGENRFYEYVRRFGFGERSNILLPGEIPGIVHPPSKWSKISITRMPMGQEVGATPLQIVSAMSVIANGGKLMVPQIVHSVLDDAGRSIRQYPPVTVRQVVSSEAAATVRDALVRVVTKDGTAKDASVDGFLVAGKTGTAQKVSEQGGYAKGKYVVSFVGFMPADDPEFACFVMLDEARAKNEENYGGVIAAPVFSRIAARAASHLNLKPNPALLAPKTLIVTQSTNP